MCYSALEKGIEMRATLSIEYWLDSGWYVGRLKEVPGVFSQGRTLPELKRNIQDAHRLMLADRKDIEPAGVRIKETLVEA